MFLLFWKGLAVNSNTQTSWDSTILELETWCFYLGGSKLNVWICKLYLFVVTKMGIYIVFVVICNYPTIYTCFCEFYILWFSHFFRKILLAKIPTLQSFWHIPCLLLLVYFHFEILVVWMFVQWGFMSDLILLHSTFGCEYYHCIQLSTVSTVVLYAVCSTHYTLYHHLPCTLMSPLSLIRHYMPSH